VSNADERTNRLREAARRKTVDAARRADAAIDDLVASRSEVTFRAVARHGHVSVDFLYRNQAVRDRISELRTSQQAAFDSVPRPTRESTVVHALTLQLRKLRDENRELRHQLAALHGELLDLRRVGAGGRPHAAASLPSATLPPSGVTKEPDW
jgi:hypothetical protein